MPKETQYVQCGDVLEMGCVNKLEMQIDPKDWDEYVKAHNNPAGRPIKQILSYLTPEERELLVSGLCPKCWDKLMGVTDVRV